jgi:hypothetical protein
MPQRRVVSPTVWYQGARRELPKMPAVSETLDAITSQLELGALDWPCIEGTKIRLVQCPGYDLTPDEHVPPLSVFYYANDTHVFLLWVEVFEQADAQTGEAGDATGRLDN